MQLRGFLLLNSTHPFQFPLVRNYTEPTKVINNFVETCQIGNSRAIYTVKFRLSF